MSRPLVSGRSRWWPRGNPAWSVTDYCPSAPSSPPSTCRAVRRTARCPRNPRGQATPVGRQQPRHPSRPGEAHSRRPDETIASKPPNPRILALRFPRSSSVSPRLPADVLGRASRERTASSSPTWRRQSAARSAADGPGVADFPGFTPWPRCGTRTGHGLGNSHRRSPEGQVSRWPTPGCGR